jgi:hypothetical protein
MMEAVRTSETSVDNHITRQYIPEDNSERWYSKKSLTYLQVVFGPTVLHSESFKYSDGENFQVMFGQTLNHCV